MKHQLRVLDLILIHHLSSLIDLIIILQMFHRHLSSMTKFPTSIHPIFLHHLLPMIFIQLHWTDQIVLHTLTLVQVTLLMIFIHLPQLTDQRILRILSHTTINTLKNHSNICLTITHLKKIPHTITPTSSLIQVLLRAVSHPSRLIILLTIKALTFPTLPNRLFLLPLQVIS